MAQFYLSVVDRKISTGETLCSADLIFLNRSMRTICIRMRIRYCMINFRINCNLWHIWKNTDCIVWTFMEMAKLKKARKHNYEAVVLTCFLSYKLSSSSLTTSAAALFCCSWRSSFDTIESSPSCGWLKNNTQVRLVTRASFRLNYEQCIFRSLTTPQGQQRVNNGCTPLSSHYAPVIIC